MTLRSLIDDEGNKSYNKPKRLGFILSPPYTDLEIAEYSWIVLAKLSF